MTDYMNDSLADLKAAILDDGIIDDDEVGKLRERLYADGVIDREEADFLFDLNDAVSGKDNAASWGELPRARSMRVWRPMACQYVVDER